MQTCLANTNPINVLSAAMPEEDQSGLGGREGTGYWVLGYRELFGVVIKTCKKYFHMWKCVKCKSFHRHLAPCSHVVLLHFCCFLFPHCLCFLYFCLHCLTVPLSVPLCVCLSVCLSIRRCVSIRCCGKRNYNKSICEIANRDKPRRLRRRLHRQRLSGCLWCS